MNNNHHPLSGHIDLKILAISLGVLLIALLAVILLPKINKQTHQPSIWQTYASRLSPIVAVFNTTIEGTKAAVRIDETSGQVGFGSNNYRGEKLQLFTKMVGGNFIDPIQADNKIKWLSALPGIDVEVHTFDGNIKEFIHINNKEAVHAFAFELEQKGEIELRDEAGMYITVLDKKTGEELFTLDYPIAIDAQGKKIPYHYRLENLNDKIQMSKTRLILEVHDPKLLLNVKYPLVLDPPLTVREYDEMLIKIGQNGNEPGNAKDGDIVEVKPAGWPWGDLEYRDYVIVRVKKMTEEERLNFNKRFESITNQERFQAMENKESPLQSQTKHLDGAYLYGLDYVSLINDERVKIIKKNDDGTEEETIKDGLVEMIRDRAKVNPVIDATELDLNEIIKEKVFAQLYREIKDGRTKLALNELPGDESVLPSHARLAKRLEDKKSWLAQAWDKLVKPARAATNTYTVGTNSRNYSTLQAWEDARDAGTDIEKGECYNDSTFTAGVTIDGTTGDADSYMWLTVASGNRHNGTAGTGVKVDPTTVPVDVIYVRDDYTKVEWLEITGFTESSSASSGVHVNYAGNTIIAHNLIHDNAYWGRIIGVFVHECYANNLVYNNIIYCGNEDTAGYAGIEFYWNDDNQTAYNNTIVYQDNYGAGIFLLYSDNVLAKNNVVKSYPTYDFYADTGASFDGNSNYNASADTTSPGLNSQDNIVIANVFTNTTVGSENLHLKAGASVINAGDDLSGTFTTDIDGETRPTGANTWDIGADEIVTADSISWWNSAWSKRKAISIEETSGGDLTNYPVKLTVSYDNDMINIFTDLRFTNDSDTPLDYWIETVATSTSATVWVEIDSLPASATTIIYMYYGNPNAPSGESGDNTFTLFDDFESYNVGDSPSASKFTTTGTNGTNFVNIQTDPDNNTNKVLKITEPSDGIYTGFTSAHYTAGYYAIHMKMRFSATVVYWGTFNAADAWQITCTNGASGVNRMRYYTDSPAQYNDYSPSAGDTSLDTWYDIEHRMTSSTYHMYRDGVDYTGAYRATSPDTSDSFLSQPANNQTNNVYYDDIYVRKYVANEPTSTFGTEEISPINYKTRFRSGTIKFKSGNIKIK